MSQAGRYIEGTGAPPIETITGNSGGPVGPDGAGNLNLIGSDPIDVVGDAGTNTLTISVADASETQKGVAELATNAETIAGTDTERIVTPDDLKAKLGAQTANGVSYGAGTTSVIGWTAAGTDGQLLIAATGLAPAFATLTSSGGTIDITPGPNTLNIDTTSSVATSYDTDAGTAVPAAGVLTVAGGSNIGTTGAGSTVTINLDDTVSISGSMTAGTGFYATTVGVTITQGNLNMPYSSSDESSGVITYGTESFIIVTEETDNQFMGIDSGISVTSGTGNIGIGIDTLTALTDGDENTVIGYLAGTAITTGGANTILGANAGSNYTVGSESSNILIKNAGTGGESNVMRLGTSGSGDGQVNSAYIAGINNVNVGSVVKVLTMSSAEQIGTANITAGSGISVTPSANAITIATTAGITGWTVVTGTTQAMAVNSGYIANNAGTVTMTLPSTAAVGSIFRVTGINNATGWSIAQNAGQQIHFGTSSTTVGVTGSVASTQTRDSVELLCVVANTTFNVLSSVGNLTVT